MSNLKFSGERSARIAEQLLAVPTSPYQQRGVQAALGLFLDLRTKTALHRAETVSSSARSRLLNVYEWDTAQCWTILVRAQWDALLLAAHRKRRPQLQLCVDSTSIPKTSTTLPFVRVYNEVHGIYLVVLYAVYRNLKFPVGYRVYRGKGTTTPVKLALELLNTVPDVVKCRFDVWTLADSGFEAADVLQGVRDLGFEFVVGVRATRQTDHPQRTTVSDCPHGAWINLKNWDQETLTLARMERGNRKHFSVTSQLLTGREVARESGRRWAIESFFKEGKHQFGLAQFTLRTATGLDRWVLLVFTAFTLTLLHHTQDLTLEEAAFLALTIALPFVRLNRFLRRLAQEEQFLRQHRYTVQLSRCNC